jgi:opacity protein-like surface antigen
MKRSLIGAAVALACICSASVASAQSVSPIRFGIAGGLSIPQGDDADFVGTGYNITGTLGFQAPMVPVGLRFDLGYNGFGEKDDSGITANVISGTLNGIFNLSAAPAMSPYLIGGVGMYRYKVEIDTPLGDGEDSATDIGLNGGIGLRFGLSGFSTFAEARYHYVMNKDDDVEGDSNSSFIPITFGIMF